MTYKTYAQMKTKIERDWDLESEEMIPDTELMEYFNDAIREAEANIHRLGVEDKYFEKSEVLALVNGTAQYSLPTTIYANKVLKIIYNNGSKIYEIQRLRGKDKYAEVAIAANASESNPYYKYLIRNDSSAGNKIQLVPASTETSASNVTVWFIRAATVMSTTSSICDIPEFYNFIYASVSWRILGKDTDPRAGAAKAELERQRMLMIETLETMVDDGDNEIIPDTSHYEEMS